jgi:hypothetical protein
MTLMRAVMLVAALAVMLPLSSTPAPAQAANCEFVLGFKAIHDMIPDMVGDCVNSEYHGSNGDGLQNTTAWHGKGGLLAWRKADNWTAFTDGGNTWVNGPNGLQKRANGERYPWEANPENLPLVGGGTPMPTVAPPTQGPNTPTPPTATPMPPISCSSIPGATQEDAEKKFWYPKGWIKGTLGALNAIIEPNGRAMFAYYAPMKLGADYKLPELAIDWQHRVASQARLTIGTLEQPTINGFPAIIQNFDRTRNNGFQEKGFLFGIKNGALVYEVDYYAEAARWGEFEPIFRCSMNSFIPKASN